MMRIDRCPFCGHDTAPYAYYQVIPDVMLDLPITRKWWRVVCNYGELGCGATTRWCESSKEAIELWNKRTI